VNQLVATNTKFICGARAYRIWIEADEGHPDVGKVFTDMIQVGRRVVVPETRFKTAQPIPIEGTTDVKVQNQPAIESGTDALTARSAIAGIPGVRVTDSYPDAEET